MAKTDLVVGLLLLDKFSKTTDKFQKELKKSGSASTAFAKAAGQMGTALSVGAVAAFGVSSVKAYGDALQSQQLLMDAFSKQPQLIGYNATALMEYNKELSTKIAYDDDEINAAQANLALFKLTGDQIKGLTPLVADLARRKGIDLATAATSVGKAMQGQARGLKDLGINFKATGDTAADYANITALLNQQVGGTAAAFAQGNPLGQLENAKIAFGNMQESVGAALLPAMTALTNIMTPLANALGSIPAPVMQIGLAMGAAVIGARMLGPAMMGAFTAIRTSATTATASIRGLAAAQAMAAAGARGLMAALGGPIGLAIIGVTAAITLFSMKSSDAAEATDDWTSSLSKQNGVLDENSKRLVAQKLADLGIVDSINRLKDAGVDLPNYIEAIAGSAQDRMMMIAQLKQIVYLNSGLGADGSMNYNMTATAALKAIDALQEYGPQIGEVSSLTGEAGAIFNAFGGAVDNGTEALKKYNGEASKTTQHLGMVSSELNRTLIMLSAPQRNVVGGETVDAWLQRYTTYMEKMGLAAEYVAPSIMHVADSTSTLSDAQKDALTNATLLGSALASITQERDSFVSGITDASMSYATVMGFDPKDFASASATVQEAIKSETTARQALFSIAAGPSSERVKAEQDLADATAARQKAQKDADAVAVTKPNILATYQDKLSKLRAFSQAIKGLISKKLSPMILQDILGAGVEGGLAMAQALNSDKTLLGDFNKTAVSIAKAGAGLAFNAQDYVFKPYITQASKEYNAAYRAAPASERGDKLQVILKLDSKTVYEQLLRLKRERGGQMLGV